MGDDSEWMKLPIDQKCEHKVSDPSYFYILTYPKFPEGVRAFVVVELNCQRFGSLTLIVVFRDECMQKVMSLVMNSNASVWII